MTDTTTTRQQESIARAIVQLTPEGARAKRIVALVTIGIPGLGFLAAVWLALAGHASALDYWLFGGFYVLHILGATIGFHRYAAHRSFKTSRAFEAVLLIGGSMALEGPLFFWVATHRRHHKFSDHLGDPHSPNLSGDSWRGKLRGLWYAHIPWMFSDQETRWSVFAPDVLNDRHWFFYNRTYPIWALSGLALPAVLGGVIGGSWTACLTGFVFGGLARVFIANQAAWCVGSVSHMFGSRPFKTNDDSANNWPVAIAAFGEGLQNNHHAFPGAYRHSMRWWEPDLSGWVLAVLAKLHIVWDLKMPSQEMIERKLRKTTDIGQGVE